MAIQSFVKGSSVHLVLNTRNSRTKAPMDLANGANLDSITKLGVAVTVNPTAFTRMGTGQYELVIDSTALAKGTYQVIVKADHGASGVVLVKNSFVVS